MGHGLLAACLTVPLVLATLTMLGVAAAESIGVRFLHLPAPANLAEAAATGRADDVVRRLRAGEDPNHVYPLAPEAISSTVRRATALEAAIWSRQLRMIEVLDRAGAIRAADRAMLACLASDLDAADIAEYLAPGAATACRRSEAYDRVLARTPRPQDD